jgi:predicted enzyme related to lactoylglutathione lyase
MNGRAERQPIERESTTMLRMSSTPRPGTITWHDLTVADASQLRDFYQAVVGWAPQPLGMGEYTDFLMRAGDEDVAGVCHARGANADLPPQWLLYITVADIDASLAECERLGGHALTPVRSYGGGRYCVIQDPAGAVCALYQAPSAA